MKKNILCYITLLFLCFSQMAFPGWTPPQTSEPHSNSDDDDDIPQRPHTNTATAAPITFGPSASKLIKIEQLSISRSQQDGAEQAKQELIGLLTAHTQTKFNRALMFPYFMWLEENGRLDASDFLEATKAVEPKKYIDALIKVQMDKQGCPLSTAVSRIISYAAAATEAGDKGKDDQQPLLKIALDRLSSRYSQALQTGESVVPGFLEPQTQVHMAAALSHSLKNDLLLAQVVFNSNPYNLLCTFQKALKKEKYKEQVNLRELASVYGDFSTEVQETLKVEHLLQQERRLHFSTGEIVVILFHVNHITRYQGKNAPLLDEPVAAKAFRESLKRIWLKEKTSNQSRELMNAIAKLSLLIMQENILTESCPEPEDDDDEEIPARKGGAYQVVPSSGPFTTAAHPGKTTGTTVGALAPENVVGVKTAAVDPQSRLNEKFTLPMLTLIKYRDKWGKDQKFDLTDRVSHKWHDAGILLGVSSATLKNWKYKHMLDANDCFKDVFTFWLNSGKCRKYDNTWQGLLVLLEDIRMRQPAEDIKNALILHFTQNPK